MEAITSDPSAEVRQRAVTLLRRLQTRLIGHGFRVEIEAAFWRLKVTHEEDRLAPARSVHLQIATGATHRLQWFLIREPLVDLEFIAEGFETDRAIERIAYELRPAAHRSSQPT